MMDTQKTDQELMESYLSGEESAFAVLYQRHSGKIYAYLRKRLNNREEVDEVFQKVFLKFHKTRKNYNKDYPIAQWLYVVAKTTLFDHFRLQNRQVKVDEKPIEEINSALLSQNESSEPLNMERDMSLLNSLSQEQRQAVEMRVIDELSYEQIAKTLNRSQDSVRQTISRALKKLRRVS